MSVTADAARAGQASPEPASSLGHSVTIANAEYVIRKGGYYYRPDAAGYTSNLAEAGRYTLEEAVKHSHPNGPDGPRDGIDYMHSPARQSRSLPGDVGMRDEFLTAYVSEDARVIGIEHETEADWQKVYNAHVALRDRLNERIAERDKCPHKPAALTPSALSDDLRARLHEEEG